MPITLEQAIAAETVMSIIEYAKYDADARAQWSNREYVYALKVRFLESPDDVFVEVKLSDGRRVRFGMRHRFWEKSGDFVALPPFQYWRPSPAELNDWYISPTGLAIIWPSLQRIAYVPDLLEGKDEGCPWWPPLPEGKRFEDVGTRYGREECIKRLDSGMIYIPGDPKFPPDDEDEVEDAEAADPSPPPRHIRVTNSKAA